jgi:hypothetical protein
MTSAFPAPAQEAWTAFSSSEIGRAVPEAGQTAGGPAAPPAPFPALTVRCPQSFVRDGRLEPGGNSRKARAAIASGTDQGSGRTFELSIGAETLSPEAEGQLKAGSRGFWDAMGRKLNGETRGGYSGSRPLMYRGLPAADIDFSTFTGPPGEYVASTLFFTRLVAREGKLLTLVCRASGQTLEGRLNGFALRDDPSVAKICLPFLDSLEFPEKLSE